MKIRFSSYAILVALATLVSLGVSCSKAPSQQSEEKQPARPAPSMPNVKVTPPVKAKAEAPTPGSNATKKAVADTFGKGQASIVVKGHPGGMNHSFWAEQLDVDGSGNPVQVDETWDNRHKVLYISNDRTFGCGNGEDASGSTLMAVYGKGNTLHRATGSGWWVTELDAGSCGVQDAGLYGCRFDGDGNNADCGVATVQSDADDVVIVPLPGAAPPSSGNGPAQPPAQPSAPAPGSSNQATPSGSQPGTGRSNP